MQRRIIAAVVALLIGILLVTVGNKSNLPSVNFDGQGHATLLSVRWVKPCGHLDVLEFETRIDRQVPCTKQRIQIKVDSWTSSGAEIAWVTADGPLEGVHVGRSYILYASHTNFSHAVRVAASLQCNPFIF